jgi:hypothetical protein
VAAADAVRAAEREAKKLCSEPDCDKPAASGGILNKCIAHGGGTRCSVEGCAKFAQTGGKCIAHGGGTRCSVEGCAKVAKTGGKCIAHGGGKRCSVEGCAKSAETGGSGEGKRQRH